MVYHGHSYCPGTPAVGGWWSTPDSHHDQFLHGISSRGWVARAPLFLRCVRQDFPRVGPATTEILCRELDVRGLGHRRGVVSFSGKVFWASLEGFRTIPLSSFCVIGLLLCISGSITENLSDTLTDP